MIKTLLLLSIPTAFFSSCNSLNGKVDVDSQVVNDTIFDGRELHAGIEFDEDFFDFGKITHGEVISHIFTFKNIGNKPLIIYSVISGCGCTKTEASSEFVKPNQKATLEVVFNSKGWYGSQYKSVTLVTNAIIPQKTVTIKANVIP
jgi:hypothetical protein